VWDIIYKRALIESQHLICIFTFWLSLFCFNPSVFGQIFTPPAVKIKSGIYNLPTSPNVLIYYDKTKKLTYSDAIHLLNAGQFSKYANENVPSKYKRGLYNNWIYFRVENVDSIPLIFHIKGNLNQDSIFISSSGKLLKTDKISLNPTKDNHEILTVSFTNIYFLTLEAGQTIEILIKNYEYGYGVGNNIPKISDTKVYEAKYYAEHNNKIFLYTSGVFVIITIILIFGFQWIFSRDKLYFWYCLYALSCLFVLWRNLEDIQPMLYWSQYYISWNDSKVFHSVAVFFTYMVFCGVFLEFNPPFLKTMVKILALFCAIAVITEIVFIYIDFDHYLRWLFYRFVRYFLTFLGLISIVLSFKSTHPLAKFIITGGSLMALAEIISMIMPVRFSSSISLLGVYADFVLFSVALGIRSKLIENEKMKLTLENLRLEAEKENAASLLKSRIARDIHDEIGLGLTSANYLLYNILNVKAPEVEKEIHRVIELNSQMVSQMHDIIWSMDASKDNVIEFCADLKAIFKEFLSDHHIQGIFNHTKETTDVKINGFMRRNILMCMKEGLNNAIKHGKPTIIDVNLNWTKVNLTLHIKDNGVGFNNKITSNPTHGNGIKNIHKRVKDCGGKVSFYNAEGANIFIEIPLMA
jgi:signal transduction histidine kinase